jgi:hypothetical protein
MVREQQAQFFRIAAAAMVLLLMLNAIDDNI